MIITVSYWGIMFEVNLDSPMTIAIPFNDNPFQQVNCFQAPYFEVVPVRSGDFVGSIKEGSPVNFFNVKINPHGNGTHTESVGHILDGHFPISTTLSKYHFVSELLSVYPTMLENGDRVITKYTLERLVTKDMIPEVLIIRTLPNDDTKMAKNYSETNPVYFEDQALQYIVELGVLHIICDIPSVDRESDNGQLLGHKAFWQIKGTIRENATITELAYIPSEIKDGHYFLNMQIIPLPIDASPSNPILYEMKKAS